MGVSGMKDRQTLAPVKTNFVKNIYERRQLGWIEFGSGEPDIQQCAVDSAPLAGLGQVGKNRATGRKVKFAPAPHADELGCSNNLQIDWHGEISSFSSNRIGDAAPCVLRTLTLRDFTGQLHFSGILSGVVPVIQWPQPRLRMIAQADREKWLHAHQPLVPRFVPWVSECLDRCGRRISAGLPV